MTFEVIALLLAAALGGGGISAVIVKLIDRGDKREALALDRVQKREELEIVNLREDVKRAREEMMAAKIDLAKCEEGHETTQRQVDELRDRVRAVEMRSPTHLAQWSKDKNKRITFINDQAYMTLFVHLGWARDEVVGKTFEELFGEEATESIAVINALDRAAIADPHKIRSAAVRLHPLLPMVVIVKVAYISGDGELKYEGSCFVPSPPLLDQLGAIREQQAIVAADQMLSLKLPRNPALDGLVQRLDSSNETDA